MKKATKMAAATASKIRLLMAENKLLRRCLYEAMLDSSMPLKWEVYLHEGSAPMALLAYIQSAIGEMGNKLDRWERYAAG